MFLKVRGGKKDNPVKGHKRLQKNPKRVRRVIHKVTSDFPNKYYDQPRPKRHGVCALVASRRKAPWEVSVSRQGQWRQLVSVEIKARRCGKKSAVRTKQFLHHVMQSYKESREQAREDDDTPESSSSSFTTPTAGLFSQLKSAKSSEKNLSIMFASRQFPELLQCSNDLCRKQHPDDFLSHCGRLCKHCRGRDFNLGHGAPEAECQEVIGGDSSYASPRQDHITRYYYRYSGPSEGLLSPDQPKQVLQPAALPEALTTAQYMARVLQVQQCTAMMTRQEYFSHYGDLKPL